MNCALTLDWGTIFMFWTALGVASFLYGFFQEFGKDLGLLARGRDVDDESTD